MRLRRRIKISRIVAWSLMAVSLILVLWNVPFSMSSHDTDKMAARFSKSLETRMDMLDDYMRFAADYDNDKWLPLGVLPSDMVIYKYVDDTLKFWDHQFTINNDDITANVTIPILANPRAAIVSPLAYATEKPELMDMGSKWYMVKALQKDNVRIIGGLTVIDDIDGIYQNASNPRLKLDRSFIINTLDSPVGAPVYLYGEPVMNIYHNVTQVQSSTNVTLLWIALLLLIIGAMLMLTTTRERPKPLLLILLIFASIAGMFVYGARTHTIHPLFSPDIYADGPFFYSLGALLLVNMALLSVVVVMYICSRPFLRSVIAKGKSVRMRYRALMVLWIVGIMAYVLVMMRSVILNSSMTLELYRFNFMSWEAFLILISFIALLLANLIPYHLARNLHLGKAFIKDDKLTRHTRLVAALSTAAYIMLIAGFTGFDKEYSRQEVWARRLSMSRDVSLELQLRSVENAIAFDPVIGTLAGVAGSENMILNRLADNYLQSASQSYTIKVGVYGGEKDSQDIMGFIRDRLKDNQPLADNSRFSYYSAPTVNTVYTGVFTYMTRQAGMVYLVLDVQAKSTRQDKGYTSLLGLSTPGRVTLPAAYSYARYAGRELVAYEGSFGYPTTLGEDSVHNIYVSKEQYTHKSGHTHFINRIGTDSAIIISRPKLSGWVYLLALLFLTIALYSALSFFYLLSQSSPLVIMPKKYYRSTATTVLVVSLTLTLIVMAIVSVWFVYDRNETNMKGMMAEKVSSIQALLQEEFGRVSTYEELDNPRFNDIVRMLGDMTHSDISLFNTSGRVFKSTIPEVYERMMVGTRINQSAYDNIVYHHMRYFIQKEEVRHKKYFSMYAPLFAEDGSLMAIVNSPYINENYDFRTQAVIHLIAIITVFMVLLLIARLSIESVLNRLFSPLVDLGSKMRTTEIDKLEYLEYDRDDEITTLVQSYNRMVDDLKQSSQKLAQTERDRAWSAMARQVAHEIKNPLTPIKLQIQRLIRLKGKNDPSWPEKFDECMKVVLDHIDILTDTANEFSTFAKLYSEDPTLINLDKLLQEEIAMFDNRDNIEFIYAGLDGARVMAPKPQLTRVFVNLITNSVQAIDARREEQKESGAETEPGRIFISLRHSSKKDGSYDIVFEDNGPGVSEENRDKLFTPNFTTKSGGTGLGLAICHSILEKCDATISYTRSFALGGACFTIVYPGYKEA